MLKTAKKTEIPADHLNHTANTWLLGADPEFAVLRDDSKIVHNADPYRVEFNVVAGNLGRDHGGRLWELRPTPATSAFQVVTNIWKLLNSKQLERIQLFRWKAGGVAPEGLTLGGHVHFGLPTLGINALSALERMLMCLTHLDILPQDESLARAAQYPDYGGIIRPCNGHVEYRAAPSWLDKPGQALAVLTTAKLAVLAPSELPPYSGALKLFLAWLENWAIKDIDAWLLHRLIDKRGLTCVQADGENFRPRWQKEELWR